MGRPLCRFASLPAGRTAPSMAASRWETNSGMAVGVVVRKGGVCGLFQQDFPDSGVSPAGILAYVNLGTHYAGYPLVPRVWYRHAQRSCHIVGAGRPPQEEWDRSAR